MVVAAVSLLWAAVPSALASEGYTVNPPQRFYSFITSGSNSYIFSVATLGHRWLEVLAIGPDGAVSYIAPARIHADRMQATIGSLGTLSMRFLPVGKARRSTEPQGDCRGRRALVQKGVFVGHFVLAGENGFTSASVGRIRGLHVRSFREVCKGADAGDRPKFPREDSIEAVADKGSQSVDILVSKPARRDEPVTFVADVHEATQKLWIVRSVFGSAERNVLSQEPDGSFVFGPPAPLSGAAEFRPVGSGRSGEWIGSLSAQFPGLGPVSLAGADFVARHVRHR